jgi:hypothetical protein
MFRLVPFSGQIILVVIDWQLACHDRRSAVVPILDDFKYVAALLLGERGEAPIIQDQSTFAVYAL